MGTTIRLSVFARRREIEIMKYVGATNALVTLPFVIEGLVMGLISGIITAAASIGGYAYIVEISPTLGGKKKIYYISAEFLIGKLLSNNLINLGIYDDVAAFLKDRSEPC